MNSSETFVANDLLQQLNLSKNKSLRMLETTGESIRGADDLTSDFLKTVLSSITSSAPLDIVVIYRDYEICGQQDRGSGPFHFRLSSQEVWDSNLPYYRRQLRVFRGMYRVRGDFRLVLCADVPDFMVERALDILGRVVEAGKVMGLGHSHEPLVISERRTLRTRNYDLNVGYSSEWYVPASAL